MVDIETLSTANNAVVTSLGFIPFDADGIGQPRYYRLRWEDQMRSGKRDTDPETLKFWLDQPREVMDKWVKPQGGALAARDETVLGLFWRLVGGADRVWANSPQFDTTILKTLSDDLNVSVPRSHYRKLRDIRTISDFLTADEKNDLWSRFPATHDPVADCISQIAVVQSVWKKFGSPYGVLANAETEPATEPVPAQGEEGSAPAQEGASS
jgi:hypothetical protein